MITKANQSYVNKIKNGRLHSEVKENDKLVLDEREQARYDAAKKIMKLKELPTSSFTDDDFLYLHLLKFFLVPREQIIGLYNHMSKRKISRLLMKKHVEIGKFNSKLLGIPKIDYLDLIIDNI